MKKFTALSLQITALALASQSVFGAGFQLQERSGSGLGRAFSGEAAIADDASVLASNPAGLIKLDDNAISAGVSYINPGADVSGTVANGAIPATSDDVGEEVFVPYLYYAKKINENLSFGLGSFTTYGLATDYQGSFNGLASADQSELRSVNLNPSIAFRINDQWSIGAGFNILYAEGTISSTAGPLGIPAAPPIPGVFPGAPAVAPGNNVFDLEGDDFGFGYNIGVLYELSERTRFGLHFRSKIDLELDGEAELGNRFGPLAGTRDATLDVSLPATIEFSAYHEINDCWAIHGDIVWTDWSTFEELRPRVDGLPDDTFLVEEDWDDAYRFAIGATYKASDRITLRAGVAYDESPTPDRTRTLRIPDEDRIWVSFGATIALNENYNLDLGYTHIFIDDAEIIDDGGFSGEASGDVDLFAVGISGNF